MIMELELSTKSSNTKQLFLSVTILNYNYARYLKPCIDSILQQTLTDFEIILINDCSTDNSLEVIQPYLKDPRIKLINHIANKGFVTSLIEGCDASSGKYITVISADDYVFDPTAFEIAYNTLEENSDIALFFSAWCEVDNQGVIRYERHAANVDYVADGVDQYRHQILASSILHTGTIILREAYYAVGGYDKTCKYAVDNNLWLVLCSAGRVAYSNKILYVYRAHSSNMSNSVGAFWRGTEEMFRGIDYSLSLFSEQQLPDKKKLRRLGYQRALVAVPTHDIFAGRYGRGCLGYWTSLRHYPLLTLLQARTPSLIIRTLLGGKLYDRVRQTLGINVDKVSSSKINV